MARWQPDARGRLEEAAMALYARQGYARTTVAEIAASAGLTERTFFRHFSDKREVLFGGTELLTLALRRDAAAAPAGLSPLGAVASALGVIVTFLDEHRGRAFARRRQAIIAANDELRERELIKMSSWADALAAGLRDRGVAPAEASLTAQAGVAAFRVAFAQWVDDDDSGPLRDLMSGAIGQVAALAV